MKVAVTLNNLANAHGDLGHPQKKRELLERVLPINERHFGPEHVEVAVRSLTCATWNPGLGKKR